MIADRCDKRRLLFLTQTSSAVGSAVFGILVLSGTTTHPLVLALSLALGCLTVVDNPARQSPIADLVDRGTLANAVAWGAAILLTALAPSVWTACIALAFVRGSSWAECRRSSSG